MSDLVQWAYYSGLGDRIDIGLKIDWNPRNIDFIIIYFKINIYYYKLVSEMVFKCDFALILSIFSEYSFKKPSG